ncbi:MAG: hypothetical protein WBM29_10650 [Candidatus Deferrimicrobium sp.]
MKRTIFLIAALFAFLSFHQAASPPMAYSETGQAVKTQPAQPGSNFQKANESFLKKDFKASAAEIRKGSDYIKKETEAAGEEGKKMLTASTRELDELADSVEKGAVKSDKKLKAAFSRAEHAISNDYYAKATESWARKKTKETGEALNSAAEHMENAVDWSSRKLKEGASKAIKEGREVSGKLVAGTGYVSEEVGKGLKNMGDAISEFGRRIVPGKQ